MGFSPSVTGVQDEENQLSNYAKCAEPRGDTVGCWEVCACVVLFRNTSDDDKMMSQPFLMNGVKDKKFSRATHICYCGGFSDIRLRQETEKKS